MLRHVLVCLKPSPENQACQAAAVDLAVQTGAVLSGVYVRQPAPLPVPILYPSPDLVIPGPFAAAAFNDQDERVVEHRAEEDRRQTEVFASFLRRAQSVAARAGTITRTGEIQSELLTAARATDLVMLGRGYHPSETLLGSVTGAIVRHAGRPVLVVPEWRVPLKRIAVAYDGSLGADRALAAAAELASSWRGERPEIALIAITHHDHDSLEFLEPARRYLNTCDLPYTTRTAAGDPAVLINALALSEDASLLCAGAFGHSLLREALLGSTTQTILASWTRALLLCH